MIDLKHFGGGRKLIEEIISKSKSDNQPWTKTKQYEKAKKIQNPHTRQSRSTSKF